MGFMTKMRENTKYVLWFVVFAFGALFMLQDAGTFDFIGAGPRNVIVVDGEPVSLAQYRDLLDNQERLYQNQTGQSMTQQAMDRAHEMVYNQLVDGVLIENEMNRLGITVTDDELVDLIQGENPHPMIVSRFSNGQGELDRTLLQSFIDNQDLNQDWAFLEAQLRDIRRREKLQELMEATVHVSEEEIQEEYNRQNLKIDTRFVALRYAAINDSVISYTDRDLQNFYNENREDFKRKKSYTLQYASIPLVPSRDDTLSIMDEMERIKPQFAEADNDSLFLARYASAQPYASTFFLADDLDYELGTAIYDQPESGRIIGPIVVGDEIRMIKIQDFRPSEDRLIRARHILFRASPNNSAEQDKARSDANDVLQRLRNGEDFATLAKLFSTDNVSAARGGDLGWFGRGKMVEPFEDAAFGARIGRVVGPIESAFGYHLIEVTQETEQEVRLADYVQVIEPSRDTMNDLEEQLDDIKYYAEEENKDFQEEARTRNINVQEVQVQEDQSFISGLGTSRQILNFLQAEQKGNISDVIQLDEMFVVARLVDIVEEGYRPFDEVKAQIEPRLKLEKKKGIQRQRLEEALTANGFDGLANAVGAQERVVTAVTYNTRSVADLGNDPIFKGTVFSMESGQTSPVVEGRNGVFVVNVTKVDEPAAITDAQKTQIENQLLTELRNKTTSEWLASLREEADVKDNRRFFGM